MISGRPFRFNEVGLPAFEGWGSGWRRPYRLPNMNELAATTGDVHHLCGVAVVTGQVLCWGRSLSTSSGSTPVEDQRWSIEDLFRGSWAFWLRQPDEISTYYTPLWFIE